MLGGRDTDVWPCPALASARQVAEETQKKIEAASQQYRPCSVRASVLYFVLNDLSTIDPMYQFSLDAYVDLFLISMRNSPKPDQLAERIKSLNDFHTYAVYKYTSRGLFERHKLLLSLQMCVRILQTANQVSQPGASAEGLRAPARCCSHAQQPRLHMPFVTVSCIGTAQPTHTPHSRPYAYSPARR